MEYTHAPTRIQYIFQLTFLLCILCIVVTIILELIKVLTISTTSIDALSTCAVLKCCSMYCVFDQLNAKNSLWINKVSVCLCLSVYSKLFILVCMYNLVPRFNYKSFKLVLEKGVRTGNL